MKTVSRVTVLGCGLMGSAIIRELYRKGQNVVAWNRSSAPLQALSQEGIPNSTDLASALIGSDTLIAVLSSYSAVRSMLDSLDAASVAGKTIINLTSGSAEDAVEMSAWAKEVGVDYLDGSIWVLPSMIGAPATVISCAGPRGVWEQVESLLKILGGASFHAGEAIENGNVLEACFPGAFYMTAQHCFVESIARAMESGIDFQTIARAVAPSVELLQTSLEALVDKLIQNKDTADEASLDVWFNAAQAYRSTSSGNGTMSPFLDILLSQLNSALASGLGSKGPSAMLGHLHKTDQLAKQ